METRRIDALREAIPFLSWYTGSRHRARYGDPAIVDFMFGNPHDMPLPGFVDALRRHIEPLNKDWYAYKFSEREATEPVAASLARRTGLAWDPDDVVMTNGALAAIPVTLRAIVEPGDEVVFLAPPYFFYEMFVRSVDGEGCRVALQEPDFRLDEAAIASVEAAITPRTRAVILNSPTNPTGRVYDADELRGLASALERASARLGRPVWLISDEAYNRIVFDGRHFHSPSEFYAHTFVIYTYGKTLLAPGQRLGYIALPPTMPLPERQQLRDDLFMSQVATGWALPNALLQHAMADIEPLSIDIEALQRRRDRLVPALREMGYEAILPEGTFYVMVRSPIEDDARYADLLADEELFVMPGWVVELPGWFRLSLTANDAMIERGLPIFERVRAAALAAER